jgi:hypothetical protein
MARAYERLAEWDQDGAAAMWAVEHVGRSVQLYTEDGAVLSRAFGQVHPEVHLADALADAGDFARWRDHGEQPGARSRRSSRKHAQPRRREPVLRAAQAWGYLERLERARGRLHPAQSPG